MSELFADNTHYVESASEEDFNNLIGKLDPIKEGEDQTFYGSYNKFSSYPDMKRKIDVRSGMGFYEDCFIMVSYISGESKIDITVKGKNPQKEQSALEKVSKFLGPSLELIEVPEYNRVLVMP